MLENAIVPMFLLQVMLECAALIRSIAIYVKRMRFCSNVFATHVRTCVFIYVFSNLCPENAIGSMCFWNSC